MKKGTYTTTNSDLFWKVYKVHHIGKYYIKAKIMFFYKSSDNIVWHLNKEGKAKNFKIIREVAENWKPYNPYKKEI